MKDYNTYIVNEVRSVSSVKHYLEFNSKKEVIEFMPAYSYLDFDSEEWENISRLKLSDMFIDNYKDLLNWNVISRSKILTDKFIKKYKTYIKWGWISGNKKLLSINFIRKYLHLIHWDVLSQFYIFDIKFIKEFKSKINWYYYLQMNANVKHRDQSEII